MLKQEDRIWPVEGEEETDHTILEYLKMFKKLIYITLFGFDERK